MNILIVEDNPLDAKIISKMLLTDSQFEIELVDTLSAGLDKLKENATDLLLLDLNLPDSRDIMTFQKVNECFPNIPVIILTGQDDENTAMEALRQGAQDYLFKGKINKNLLLKSLKYGVERKRSEEQLREKNQELEMINQKLEEMIQTSNQMAISAEVAWVELNQIFNTAADAMWVLDINFKILRINDAFLKFIGRSKGEAVGLECRKVFPCSLCDGPNCPMKLVNSSENRVEYELEALNSKGIKTPFIMTATPLRVLDGEIIGIIANFTDITNRKKAEKLLQEKNQELKHLSISDGLTKIANRRRFDECLQQEWKRLARDNKPLSLILCDIDFFKLFNDHYGHQAGDDCLVAVASAINKNAKRPADLTARYGGEEFGVILPDTDGKGALFLADIIRESVRDLKVVHAESKADDYVTLSLGVSETIPNINYKPETLILSADKALYKAKEMGRNQAHFGSYQSEGKNITQCLNENQDF